jgi:hypothetical protein
MFVFVGSLQPMRSAARQVAGRAHDGGAGSPRAASAESRESIRDFRDLLSELPQLGRAGARCAAKLRRYLDNAANGASLDDVFGLRPKPGEAAWFDAAAPAEVRRGLVLDLTALLDARRLNARATAILGLARRFEADKWPRYQDLDEPPPHLSAADQLLFQLHANAGAGGAKWPLGRRKLVEVLQSGALSTADNALQPSEHDPFNPTTTNGVSK